MVEPAEDPTPLDIRDLLEANYPQVSIDDIDRRLLLLLKEDSSQSQRALAAEVRMSAPAVAERIQRMERAGVIRCRSIELNWSALGYPMLVVVPMTITANANPRDIVLRLRQIPELTELILLTGSYDMMARFRVGGHSDLQSLLLEKIWPIPGLQRVETMISLGTLARHEPLEQLFPGPTTRRP